MNFSENNLKKLKLVRNIIIVFLVIFAFSIGVLGKFYMGITLVVGLFSGAIIQVIQDELKKAKELGNSKDD